MAKRFGNGIDLAKTELQNARVQNLAGAPGSPVPGQIYFDTGTAALFVWDGTAWYSTRPAAIAYGTTASALTVGGASAPGTATTVSRSDHVHGLPAFGAVVGQTTYGAASADGAATTLARSDHTHGTPPLPTAAQTGAVANAGGAVSLASGTLAARPAAGTAGRFYYVTDQDLLYVDEGTAWVQVGPFGTATTAATPGSASGAGNALTYSRSDHSHANDPYSGSATALTVGSAGAPGVAANITRGDHTHGLPGFGAPTAETTFGGSSAPGTATTFARADHTHGNPAHDAAAHGAIPLSALASPTANINLGGFRLTNSADPVNAADLVTKAYADSQAAGLDFKASVRAASTANIDLTLGGALIDIDGVDIVEGDRILVKNQTDAVQNGIYVAATGAWTRATDADTSGDMSPGTIVYIEEGATHARQQWVITTTGAITIGTTPITWTQFSGASIATAGAGLRASGNTYNVGAGTGIVVSADAVAIDTAVVSRKVAATIGDGTATAIVIGHNLGTRDVQVSIYENAAPFAEIETDVEHTDVNSVTIRFGTAPALNQYRVTIQG